MDVTEGCSRSNRDLSEGAICVVNASLHEYEEKLRNIAWRGPYII